MTKTVLITGAGGNIGTKLRAHFAGLGWILRLLDVTNGGDPAIQEADLSVWDDAWVCNSPGWTRSSICGPTRPGHRLGGYSAL